MIPRPAKILLLALCAAFVVPYLGKKLTIIADRLEKHRITTPQEASNDPVYARVNMTRGGGNIHIPLSRDGHYWIKLAVNGAPIPFMIDTGASYISLSYRDARAAGLHPADLIYNRVFRTANGDSSKAMVTLDLISLSAIEISGIPASVSLPGQLPVSLLGMNFLNRLSGFNVKDRELILTP